MAFDSSDWRVAADGQEVPAVFEPAISGARNPVFVFAHGAGGHMADAGMLRLAALFRKRGLDVVRFNFPYRERHSPRPDAMPQLQACIRAVASRVLDEVGPRPLILGGRSMGGRAASMLAAEGYPCQGLLLLAYPLHPAGNFEKLRAAHLARIAVPVLCFNGTRDSLCRRDLMEQAVADLGANWTMHWLEGADHSFRVTKASGRTDADVLAEIGDATESWLGGALRPPQA